MDNTTVRHVTVRYKLVDEKNTTMFEKWHIFHFAKTILITIDLLEANLRSVIIKEGNWKYPFTITYIHIN